MTAGTPDDMFGAMWGEVGLAIPGAVLVAAVLLAAGERIRRLARLPAPVLLRGPVDWALGCLAAALTALPLGLASLFRPSTLLGLLAVLALAGRWRDLPRIVRPLLPFLLFALPLVPVAVAPPFFYDAWVYHLGMPWQALQEGAIRAHEEHLFAAFPPLAQLVYAFPLAAGVPRATGLLHLLGYCIAAQAAHALVRRLGGGRPAGLVAGAALLYLPTAVMVPAFPAAEAWAVGALTTGAALLVCGRSRLRVVPLAGLVVGVAVATRVQGLIWAGLYGLALLVWLPERWRAAVLFAAGVVAGASPWWIKNGFLLGEPLAPIGWSRPGIETLWRDSDIALYLAQDPGELIRLATDAVAQRWLILAPLLLAAVAALVVTRRAASLMLAAIGSGGLVAWSLTGALGRFLVPVLLLLACVGLSVRRWTAYAAIGVVVVFLLGPGLLATHDLSTKLGGPLAVMGDRSSVYASLVVANPYPAFRACGELPRDAVVLMVGEPRGFLFPRRFMNSGPHDPSPLTALLDTHDEPAGLVAELRGRGFTHLLLNVTEIQRLASRYPVKPWRDDDGRERMNRLLSSLGGPVLERGGVVVYSLALPGERATRAAGGEA